MTVMGKVPAVVGVPDSTPPKLSDDNDRPGGKDPVSLQVSGFSPPNAVNLKLYGRFIAAPGGGEELTILGGGGFAIWIV